ncbi:hypothetical protein ACPV3U_22375 [Vibrio rotiferianus]|uniref:hypothetical protein n=1 Tax=Vibrio rotiferianus TaxID=190895 RepID=UPI00406AABA2
MFEHIQWIFSGIGNLFIGALKNKKEAQAPVKLEQKIDITINDSGSAEVKHELDPVNVYRKEIGSRHKYLREKILCFNEAKMSDFYELETVSELINYEAGKSELPKKLIAKLTEFFFFRESGIDNSKEPHFNNFGATFETLKNYMERGFRPVIVCSPEDDENFLFRVVMYKREGVFTRLIVSATTGTFSRNRQDLLVLDLIKAIRSKKVSLSYIRIVKASSVEWDLIKRQIYYDETPFERGGINHVECSEIFWHWYYQVEKYQEENCI